MAEQATIDEIMKIVRDVSQNPSLPAIGGSTPLLSSGIIDSLSLADLQEALEHSYGVSIPLGEIGFDNADTAEQLVALVTARQQS